MIRTIILLLFVLFMSFSANAQLKHDIGGQWFLAFNHDTQTDHNQFMLKRAYINYQVQINDYLSGRVTPDISIDKEGDGMGSVEMRLKYCYVQLELPPFWIFETNLKAGLSPRPWIDYEQDINQYRVEGKMFLERQEVINSADFGLILSSAIGGKISKEDLSVEETACKGKYADIIVGVYNGGGYHALENNTNKTFEWRTTFRPFPGSVPGFLLSYHGAYGEGNIDSQNLFRLHGLHLGYEHPWVRLSAQYYDGVGNYSGSYFQESTDKHYGYSGFAEFIHPGTGLALLGRYDWQQKYTTGNTINPTTRIIAGISWRFKGDSKLVLSRDSYFLSNEADPSHVYEVALDLVF